MPDTRASAELLLSEVEDQLDRVDAGLRCDQPSDLLQASGELRRCATGFARALEAALSAEALDAEFRRRIEAVAQRLSNQRDSVARRTVIVDRSLASLLGPRPDATYTMPGERRVFAGLRSASMPAH
ncbi:hypothetical protein SAMN05443579_102287 [Variovorax sp. PDC80]|jgi:hypothetical protein|uniref:hypothetical protein n=1 Tax=Variovorax sp. PDC80 TaxID=1882827 RepID=UPI0008DF8B92|nr:hypothetical protein [Variovorax sp. PDC80]SFO30010.1 hypothetical protein SAMN05443579_102287 [Variovorax sp. PDC80]